jgi:hypothetical protein
MSVRELADIDESRIELINEFEVKVTEYRKATSDLMGIKYAKGANPCLSPREVVNALSLRFPPAVPPRRPPSSRLIPTHCLEFLRLSLFAFIK